MTSVEHHYACPDLLEKIRAGLERSGKTIEDITLRDLGPVDQLHTGGAPATLSLAKQAGLSAGARLLDAGCGIGGSTRLLAETFGVCATGIDLARDFVETARTLTQWTCPGLDVRFDQGSVTQLPYPDKSFDAVLCQHILMNIQNKAAAIREFYRVLSPGGILILHEITDGPGPAPDMPVPWASEPSISFLAPWETMADQLARTGFCEVFQEDDTHAGALWWKRVNAIISKSGPRPLNSSLVFGENAARFGPNMEANFSRRSVCCVSALFIKPGGDVGPDNAQ